MQLLIPLIIFIEIIGGIIATSPAKPEAQRSILGKFRYIAEEDTPTPQPTEAQDTPTPSQTSSDSNQNTTGAPTDTITPSIQDTTAITPEPTQSSEQMTPALTPSVTETQAPLTPEPTQSSEQTTPALTPSVTETEQLIPKPSTNSASGEHLTQEPSLTVQPELQSSEEKQTGINQFNAETNLEQFNNTLTTNDSNIFNTLITTPPSDRISDQTKQETVNENNQLNQAKTPDEKAKLLVKFGGNDIQDIVSNTHQNNADEVDFHIDKLNNHLDQLASTLQQQPIQSKQIQQDLASVCQNVEPLLRTEALVVPENVEQTIDIIRGKCFNYGQ